MAEPKSVWELAEAGEGMVDSSGNVASKRAQAGDDDSSTVLVVGDTGVGKSSLIQSFLKPNSNKQPKSTFALEYSFARRKNAGSDADGKNLAHIWELGGDIYEPKLLEIALTIESLSSASVIVCVDLSKPQDCFASVKAWISTIRSHISTKFTSLKNGSSAQQAQAKAMKNLSLHVYGNIENPHVDAGKVRPCEVPITIICCKYDQFRNTHSASDRRSLIQTLRFAAHYHGASLIVTSTTDNSNNNGKDAFRAMMNKLCFGVTMKPMCEVSIDRPAVVVGGTDNFHSILIGKGTGKSHEDQGASIFASNDEDVSSYYNSSGVSKDTWSRFENRLNSIFGASDPRVGKGPIVATSSSADDGDDGANPAIEHPEADIDEARATRDLALEQYILETARRERLAAKSSWLDDIDANTTSGAKSSERDQYAENEVNEISRSRK